MESLSLAHKVATRYLRSAVTDDPKRLFKSLRRRLDDYDNEEDTAKRYQKQLADFKKQTARGLIVSQPVGYTDILDIGVNVRFFNQYFREMWPLAVTILQGYALPATVRKKVERIARFWATKQKTRKPRLPRKELEQIDAYLTYYLKNLDTLREQFAVIEMAFSKGRLIAEGDDGDPIKVRVGPFTLLNLGGFDDQVMDEVAKAVKQASDEITTSGLGKVCYGDVHVTQKVARGNTAAFYMPRSDEFFVRADKKVRATGKLVHNILHELGHRYETKFLKNEREVLATLYALADTGYELPVPDPGTVLRDSKGNEYLVAYTSGDRVHLRSVVDGKASPRPDAKIHIEGYYMMQGVDPRQLDVDFKGFVTPYAKKDPSENFAEMFAFYCVGELPPTQAARFEELVLDQ